METWSEITASVIFFGVLALIATERLHLTIAAFLGAMLLIFLHVLTLDQAIGYIGKSYATLALFFGVMVMVRAFEPTKIFEYLATQMVIMARGEGKRLLLGIVAITTPVCAMLPNAAGPADSSYGSITEHQLCAAADFDGVCGQQRWSADHCG